MITDKKQQKKGRPTFPCFPIHIKAKKWPRYTILSFILLYADFKS